VCYDEGLSGALTSLWTDHHLHHYVHIAETASIVAAIIATSAAITGEFLSIPKEHDNEAKEHLKSDVKQSINNENLDGSQKQQSQTLFTTKGNEEKHTFQTSSDSSLKSSNISMRIIEKEKEREATTATKTTTLKFEKQNDQNESKEIQQKM
jgi:hypothetical protein